jgi:transposase-like protein
MKREKPREGVAEVPAEPLGVAEAGTERSEVEASATPHRGRPGRRTAGDRATAVLELLSGKASVDQIARRFGVNPETVLAWRQTALEGIEQAFRQGSAKPADQIAAEKELKTLREAFTDLSIRHELVQRAIKQRPTRPGRSSR